MKKLLLTLLCSLVLGIGYSNAQCNALYTYSVISLTPPIVVFSDSSFGTTGPVSYLWSFGDGSANDSTRNPQHQYPSLGSYTVCLTITDTTGCNFTRCDSIFISQPVPQLYAYLWVDSAFWQNCTIPDSVSFYYSAQGSGYLPSDSMRLEIRYGDGTDSVFYGFFANNLDGNFFHSYLNAGNYTPLFIVTGPDQNSDTAVGQTIIVTASCGNISGYVYNDINGNCTFDSGEELANMSLSINNGSQLYGWTNTDANGLYSFNVPTGNTYTISLNSTNGIYGHFSPTCPPSGTLTVSTIPSTGNNFGVACPPGFDLTGSITGWGFRPGFIASVCVYVYNQNCNTPNGQIDVTLPPALTPMADTAGLGYTINGNVVSYIINSTELYWSFCFPVSVSTSSQIGDSVCIDLNINPTAGDNDATNNLGTYCFAVRNSYDPNDKNVTPAGEGAEGYIRPNTDLTYTIRFQNTGNAEAINIYILDSLSSNLDATSVKVIASSHDVKYSLLTDNVMRFSYDNINLADSNSNEPSSHGYVTYSVKQINNIAQMAQIINTAGIYFDFNQPVITNTTLNTVDQFLAVPIIRNKSTEINLFPNPANHNCRISFKDNLMKIISISNVLGEEVFRVSATDSYTLNTEKFSEGIYTIQILDGKNNTSSGKLIILH